MKKRWMRSRGLGPLEIIEQALHLLRGSPPRVLAAYYTGTAPFVLGFLFFWAEMSRSALAPERCGTWALVLVLLFCWMKFWHSIYARLLHAQRTGQGSSWNFRRLARIAFMQGVLQPWGLFLIPISAVPFLAVWVYPFFQNVTVLGDGGNAGPLAMMRKAGRQATAWGEQNLQLLSIFFLCAVALFLAMVLTLAQLPYLLKMLLGTESMFTRSYYSFLNTTFLAACLALTYMLLDPLMKAVYLLRCFYFESIRTGADLRADLKRITGAPAGMLVVLSALLIFFGGSLASAPAQVVPEILEGGDRPAVVSAAELDRAIEQTIERPEYLWRYPREIAREEGFLAGLRESLRMTFRDGWQSFTRSTRKLMERLQGWIERAFGREPAPAPVIEATPRWVGAVRVMVVVFAAAAVLVALYFVWRAWKRQRRKAAPMEAATALPDVADERVLASQLPETGWVQLARELMDKGDLRLALRAFYLATLAHLGEREMIRIAAFKSNREYEHELRRRARTLPGMVEAFEENVSSFDRAWYGLHEVSREALQQFENNLERIRSC
jgi:hypothetical protein